MAIVVTLDMSLFSNYHSKLYISSVYLSEPAAEVYPTACVFRKHEPSQRLNRRSPTGRALSKVQHRNPPFLAPIELQLGRRTVFTISIPHFSVSLCALYRLLAPSSDVCLPCEGKRCYHRRMTVVYCPYEPPLRTPFRGVRLDDVILDGKCEDACVYAARMGITSR